MSTRQMLGCLLGALFLVGLAGPVAAVKTGDPETDKALPKLICNCGGCPKLALDHCTCGTAEKLAGEALALSQQGKDSDAIVAAFVDRYGPQILAAPPPGGFDLVLWLGPAAAFVLGALVLLLYLRRRTRSAEEDEQGLRDTTPLEGLRGFDPFA